MDSPIGDDSRFMEISNSSTYEEIFCCIKGTLICGNRVVRNHSLFFSFGILKVNLPIRVLNLWLNFQTSLATFFLISFSSVIHCDSKLGFLNCAISAFLISFNVLGYTSSWTSFMYHPNVQSLNVVISWFL
jgi:hypothetical protein